MSIPAMGPVLPAAAFAVQWNPETMRELLRETFAQLGTAFKMWVLWQGFIPSTHEESERQSRFGQQWNLRILELTGLLRAVGAITQEQVDILWRKAQQESSSAVQAQIAGMEQFAESGLLKELADIGQAMEDTGIAVSQQSLGVSDEVWAGYVDSTWTAWDTTSAAVEETAAIVGEGARAAAQMAHDLVASGPEAFKTGIRWVGTLVALGSLGAVGVGVWWLARWAKRTTPGK